MTTRAALGAVAGHEALDLGVREAVILGDQEHLLVALGEGDIAQAHHPLRAFGVEAVEVGRRILQRRRLRARRAVDEDHLGMGLRVVLDRDALVARERADHDVDLVLLDGLAGRGDGLVRRGVGRILDDLDLLAAGHAVVLLHRKLDAAVPVHAGDRERSLEIRQRADLDGLLSRRRAGDRHGEKRGP